MRVTTSPELLASSQLMSVTCTVKAFLHFRVRVPEIIPELGASLRPTGREPEMTNQV